jgi:uncharacterized membrane protein
MTAYDAMLIVLRLMHILAAITAVGGSIFIRLVLVPSIGVVSEADRASLHEAMRARWSKLVAGSILFLLVSGLTNFVLTIRAHEKLPPLYHALFGVKFILALAVFMLASLLAGKSAAAHKVRRNLKRWVTVNVVLAVLIVAISGGLRIIDKGPKKADPAAGTAPQTSSKSA